MVNFLTGKIKGHPRYAEIVAEKSEDTADIGALAPGDLIAYFHIGLRTYTHLAMFLGGGRIACHSYGRSDQPDCTWDQDWNLGQGVPGDPAQPRTHQWTFLRFVV
jgi:hypothetical protein